MKPLIRRKKRISGFTLIEVLLVLFILTLSALMYAATFPTSQISRIKATHMSYALGLAQQKVEEMKTAGYANIQITDGTVSSALGEIPGGVQNVTVTQFAPNIKQVAVQITWGGYRRVGGTVNLITLISDHS